MIEITQIFLQLFIFIFFTLFPLNKYLLKGTYLRKITFFSALGINSLFLMFVLLITSFFKLDLTTIFWAILIAYSLLTIKCLSNYLSSEKKNSLLKFFFCFTLICFFFNTAYDLTLGWDALNFWIDKTNFFFNGGYLFNIYSGTSTLPHYPHLGTYVWAFFWKNSFLNYEYIGRLFYDYIYVVALFSIINTFKNIDVFKKLFILILLIFCTFNKELAGYQDPVIFSILTIIGSSFVNSYKEKNQILIYSSLLLGGIILPWIKTEGMVYSGFLIIIFLIYEMKLNNFRKDYIKYFIPLMIMLSIVIRLKVNISIHEDNIFLQRNFNLTVLLDSTFSQFLYKMFLISLEIIKAFFKYPISLFNIIIIFYSLYFYKKIDLLIVFLLFFILNFIFIFATYLTTPADLSWHLSTSLDKVLYQTCGFYFAVFSLLNKKKIINFNSYKH